jgi:phage/plasmid-like protein (TIGR03299 family)
MVECHKVETMAYAMRNVSSVPWHGLGEPVIPGTTPREMAKHAGIEWIISKRPAFIPIGSSGETKEVGDYFFLVRDSDESVLGPCGKEYLPTQNLALMEFLERYTKAGRMTIETAGSLQGGRYVWVLASLNLGFTLPGGDENRSYFLIVSPHIWGKALIMKFTNIRTVCWNTLMSGLADPGSKFRIPHVKEFDQVTMDQAEAALHLGISLANKHANAAQLMSQARLSEKAKALFVADVMQPDVLKKQYGTRYSLVPSVRQASLICDPLTDAVDVSQFKSSTSSVLTNINKQPGASLESSEGTVWGALNGITHYVDHVAGRGRDSAIFSAWLGKGAVLKQQAYNRAMEISNIIRLRK